MGTLAVEIDGVAATSRSFPTRAPAASAASSAGAGSLSGPRRSRTLTTRIALPIARIPRATARPQPQMASRPDDRSNGERTCSVPNDRTTALASGGGPLGRSTQRSISRSTPNSDPIARLSTKGGMPGKGVHLPLPAHRTGADRSMRSCFHGQCVTGRRSPVLRPIRQQSNSKEIHRWKRRQHRRRESSMA